MADPLNKLRKIVSTCTSCGLFTTRTKTVFGKGPIDAPLMIIGEAPGQDEDRTGVPFVGRAGQLLDRLLAAARVPEDRVYCANVLKCRPPNNKFPGDSDEPDICRGYLVEQIKIVRPRAILLAGKQALRYTLFYGTTEPYDPIHPWINKVFRRRDLFGDTRFLVVYHPSYLCRSDNEDDQEAWIQSVAQLWSYVQHKLAGTVPAPAPFQDIRSPIQPPRMGRNIFGASRGKVL